MTCDNSETQDELRFRAHMSESSRRADHSMRRPCAASAASLRLGVGGVCGCGSPLVRCLPREATSTAGVLSAASAADDPALKQLSSEAAGFTAGGACRDVLCAASASRAGGSTSSADAATADAHKAASASAYAASTATACASAAREPAHTLSVSEGPRTVTGVPPAKHNIALNSIEQGTACWRLWRSSHFSMHAQI